MLKGKSRRIWIISPLCGTIQLKGETDMNIAVDIDDTLTESFDYFLPYVAEFFGADENELRERDISYINLPPEWKERELDFCKTYYDRLVADTPFKPDAAWGINRLRELGHKIFIITARTSDFYTDPYVTTRQELENGGIKYDRLICTFEKAKACADEGISVIIDDFPKNCEAAIDRGIYAVLFESKANKNAETRAVRAANWDEVVRAVEGIEKSL